MNETENTAAGTEAVARRPRGRRSRAESAQTRTRLLDQAEILFAAKGFRGVSLRELARATGVRPFTIQHHFGSKLGLYQTVLCRWDDEVLERMTAAVKDRRDFADLVGVVVDELFDFFLEKRSWVALTARAALGEGLPEGIHLQDRSWTQFINAALSDQQHDIGDLNIGLPLITVEGILNHHVLSTAHYETLFGRDVTDPELKELTQAHLKHVILAILGVGASPSQEDSRAQQAKQAPE